MLSIKERQSYLKELNYYTGKIDGIEGPLTKQAYRKLQKDYFTRKKDIDGIYGNDTDILLKNVYNCKDLKYFKVKEFRCNCKAKYCTGYPATLDIHLLNNLDETREHFGRSMTITSGLRCEKYNNTLKGSSKTSRHLKGKAIDSVVSGYKTLEKRKIVIDYWIKTFKESRYGYCNGYEKTKNSSGSVNASNMGKAIHLDIL